MVNTGKELNRKIRWFFRNSDLGYMTLDDYEMLYRARIENNEIIMPVHTKFRRIDRILKKLDNFVPPEREDPPL